MEQIKNHAGASPFSSINKARGRGAGAECLGFPEMLQFYLAEDHKTKAHKIELR